LGFGSHSCGARQSVPTRHTRWAREESLTQCLEEETTNRENNSLTRFPTMWNKKEVGSTLISSVCGSWKEWSRVDDEAKDDKKNTSQQKSRGRQKVSKCSQIQHRNSWLALPWLRMVSEQETMFHGQIDKDRFYSYPSPRITPQKKRVLI
jgi:hypothetical protein